MRPLSQLPAAVRQNARVVLADIDDTMTFAGAMPASSHRAMERLRAGGRIVVPVTGRPAGWCDLIARQWAVDGVVGENGALYYRYDGQERVMRRSYARTETERRRDRERLEAVAREVLQAVPASAIAADQAFRMTDLAIDFAEDVGPLAAEDVQRIVGVFEAHGATAKISSIHVNGWFGSHDKLSMARRMLRQEFGIDIDRDAEQIVFIGDSPNDQPMFAHLPNAIGVANVRDFLAEMHARPAWIASRRAAEGFVEIIDLLLDG